MIEGPTSQPLPVAKRTVQAYAKYEGIQPPVVGTDAWADEMAGKTAGDAPTPTLLSRAETERLLNEEMLPHIKALYRFALKLSMDQDAANDLVQDTYLKACRYIDNFRPGSNAKAWLFRILKNSFINEYRSKQRTPIQAGLEDMLASAGKTQLQSLRQSMADEKWSRNLIGDEVAKALNKLPVDYRIVVILCDIEEFSYEEIAKITDIPVGTVRSRLHRGRNTLREALMPYALANGFGEKQAVVAQAGAERAALVAAA